jgi:hypothetical protein
MSERVNVGELAPVTCEPDTVSDPNDGVYITYEYLGQLIRRATGVESRQVHCTGCACASTE